jgi:hypothetical protein
LAEKNCHCGAPECWSEDDTAWLASESGWHGDINGCQSSVFFIHGKKIREQRHVPEGSHRIAEMPALLERWSAGLPNASFVWLHDTGGGDAGLWIEGVRDPNEADIARLMQCRKRQLDNDRRELRWLQKRIEANQSAVAVDPQADSTGKPSTREENSDEKA